MTTRADLERRVDELAYFDELDPESQEELRRILVERASNLDQAVMDRIHARGWLRRLWDKTSGSWERANRRSPPGNQPDR